MLIRRSILVLSYWQLGHLNVHLSMPKLNFIFYRYFNAMMCKAQSSGNELICVHLFKSMCLSLPIILYAVEVVQPNKSTIRMFNYG